MSKLSEAVKNLKVLSIEDDKWPHIYDFIADRILNLEFNVYEYKNKTYLCIKNTADVDDFISSYKMAVELDLNARTTCYTIIVSSPYKVKKLTDIFDKKNCCVKSVSKLSNENEYVDISELKLYISSIDVMKINENDTSLYTSEDTIKDINDKAEAVKALNAEIDKGFRKQDTRAPLGGSSLEEDIAFNDYLHKKVYRK